jgi:glycosyltransferase involved in cell wall biosynthesis
MCFLEQPRGAPLGQGFSSQFVLNLGTKWHMNKKITLVHDWLTGMRGGEKVLELLCQRFPQADIFTLLHNKGSVSSLIESHEIKPSFLQYLPFSKTKYRHYLPLFPILAELHKVDNADIVISTSHAVAKSMVKKKGKNPLHLCYIHTPMRYVWDLFDDYFGAHRVGFFLSQYFFRPIARILQVYDVKTLDRVDLFIANSTFVKNRVKRIYGCEAKVLPPPIDVERFGRIERRCEDWFLVFTALVPYKKTEQAIEACAELDLSLKIVGSGPEESKLKKLASKLKAKVEFLGFVPDAELTNLYGNARALLFPGVEDFGIIPVEAIAAGCPVIAFGEGGILDSMTHETAILYSPGNTQGLKEGILKFEKSNFQDAALRKRAQDFSHEKFKERFEIIYNEAVRKWEAK